MIEYAPSAERLAVYFPAHSSFSNVQLVPQLPGSLLPAADARIAELHRRPQPLATVGREQVQKADVQRLQPAQWLNDEIINFYGAMITARSERWAKLRNGDPAQLCEEDLWFGADELGGTKPPKGASKANGHSRKRKDREYGEPVQIHYFNTFFYSKLTTTGYEKAKLNKWTKKVREDSGVSGMSC